MNYIAIFVPNRIGILVVNRRFLDKINMCRGNPMWLPRAATQGRPYKSHCPGLAVVMVMVATAKREKNGKQTQIQQSQFVKTEDGKPKTDNREKMENKANVNISNIV